MADRTTPCNHNWNTFVHLPSGNPSGPASFYLRTKTADAATYDDATDFCSTYAARMPIIKTEQDWRNFRLMFNLSKKLVMTSRASLIANSLCTGEDHRYIPVWTGLRNPDGVTCSGSGCDGQLKWIDGSAYKHQAFKVKGGQTASLTVPAEPKVAATGTVGKELVGRRSGALYYPVCQLNCIGTVS